MATPIWSLWRAPNTHGEGMIRIGSVVWGVRDIPRAVEFWSAVLGYGPLYGPDVDWALLVSPDGVGPVPVPRR